MLTQILLYGFVGIISSIAPAKRIRVKANSKAWFDNQIVSVIQRRDKLYKMVKHSDLETDKDNLKSLKCTRRKCY